MASLSKISIVGGGVAGSFLFSLLKKNTDHEVEIFDIEKFVELSDQARLCAVKRLNKVVKLKLRTRKKLFTLKVDPSRAEEVVKKLRCEIAEV